MINFRFHLVSLVAVFLALAIGVVMGSTVIDKAIVDGLRSRIDRVERNSDARRAENVELKRQLDGLDAYAEAVVPHLVEHRLDKVPVVVVATSGVSDDVVRAVAETFGLGGADLAGVLWLEPKLALTDLDRQDELGRAVGQPFVRGEPLRVATIDALGRRLALGPAPVAPEAEDLLLGLQKAGFVRFAPLGDEVDLTRYPAAGARVVVIDGTEAKLDPALGTVPLVRVMAGAGAPVAMTEVFTPNVTGRARGDVVKNVRDDRDLAARVATVDDLDEPQGRTAAVLAVEGLGGGRVGHYGQGPGASRPLPELVPASTPTSRQS